MVVQAGPDSGQGAGEAVSLIGIGDPAAVVGAGEAGAVLPVVGGVKGGALLAAIFGRAVVLRVEGVEEFADGFDRLGDRTGRVELGLVEIAVGADEVFVIAGDVADGVARAVIWFGDAGPGARQGHGGDAQDGGGGAGGVVIEGAGEDPVKDLRGHELDGGSVFQEGDRDAARVGQRGAAVAVVGEAEVESADNFVFAAVAAGSEGAALRALGGNGVDAGVSDRGAGDRNRFRERLVLQGCSRGSRVDTGG